jgi:tryptophanase
MKHVKKKSDRVKRHSPAYMQARCTVCDWECSSKNALGVAAQHCDKHGHEVFVDIERTVGFTPREQYEARQKEKTGK